MKRCRKYRYDGLHFLTDLAIMSAVFFAICCAIIYFHRS